MHGLLLIDKPQGMTSHDVVAKVRRIISIRAIGHAGTLDPFATGLLILCIGHATRLSEYLISDVKRYRGRMKLGERTNTDDLDGEVIEQRPVQVSAADLARARDAFVGDVLQVPPQYSAIQVGGKRAYKMARHGETVDLPARQVRIEQLELAFADEDDGRRTTDDGRTDESSAVGRLSSSVNLAITCTAGTYVRALARDIGEMLGCGAHLTMLRRVQSGPFTLDEAITLETLQQAAANGDWQRRLLPMDRGVSHLPAARLDAATSQRFLMGQFVTVPDVGIDGNGAVTCRVYDANGQFVAIGEYACPSAILKPVKVFHNRE